MIEKNSFIFYTEWQDCFAALPFKEQSQLLMALIEYQTTGIVPKLEGAVQMAFLFIKKPMDQNRKKYEEKCKASQENGRKGGRPSKTQQSEEKPEEADESENNPEEPNETQWVFEEPGKADNDNEDDNDTERDREKNKGLIPPISPNGDISPQGDAPPPASVKEKKPLKTAYGEFGRVRLTEEEYTKLVQRLGKDEAIVLIERLDIYVESKGTKYKSHYATLLNWWRKDHPEGGTGHGGNGQAGRSDPKSPWNYNLL